jgi:hypothetical protein
MIFAKLLFDTFDDPKQTLLDSAYSNQEIQNCIVFTNITWGQYSDSNVFAISHAFVFWNSSSNIYYFDLHKAVIS